MDWACPHISLPTPRFHGDTSQWKPRDQEISMKDKLMDTGAGGIDMSQGSSTCSGSEGESGGMRNWGLRYKQMGFVLEARSLFSLHWDRVILVHIDTTHQSCFLFDVYFLLSLLLHRQIWITSRMGSWICTQEAMKWGRMFGRLGHWNLLQPIWKVIRKPKYQKVLLTLSRWDKQWTWPRNRKASLYKGRDATGQEWKEQTQLMLWFSLTICFLCNRKSIVEY